MHGAESGEFASNPTIYETKQKEKEMVPYCITVSQRSCPTFYFVLRPAVIPSPLGHSHFDKGRQVVK